MKSVTVSNFGGPEVLKLVTLADPTPGPGQIVVRVHSVGLNPVDTYIRAGAYGPKTFPYTPGTDAAGVIDSVGTDVKNFKAGDRVYIYGSLNGAYTEMALCNAEQVHLLPDVLTFDEGAAIGVPFGTAYRGLMIRGAAKPNETVLIHGASGGVGTAAVQIAANLGCRVLGTAGTPEGLTLIQKLGASYAFDHHAEGYLQQITDATGGKGVDLIIEFLADKNLDKDLGILAPRGRVVIIGNRGKVEINPRKTMVKDSDIRGMSLMNADAAELALIHAALAPGFRNGTFKPVVRQHLPLADAAKAHELVLQPGAHGKIVLRC